MVKNLPNADVRAADSVTNEDFPCVTAQNDDSLYRSNRNGLALRRVGAGMASPSLR